MCCNRTLSDFRWMSGQLLSKMDLWEEVDNKPGHSKHLLHLEHRRSERRGRDSRRKMVAGGQGVQLLYRREMESQSM
jgi:hypothetical protein